MKQIVSDHNKEAQLEHELAELSLQKYAVNEFLSSHSQPITALMNLKKHGIIEEQIISMNNFVDHNGFKASSYGSTK